MPLLGDDEIELHTELPIDPQSGYPISDGEVFFLELTGEYFTNYRDYSDRVILYKQKIWTDRHDTSKRNMTYKQALESEAKTLKRMQQKSSTPSASTSKRQPFPHHILGQVCRLAHHNTANLRQICDDIYDWFLKHYVVGEEVQCELEPGQKQVQVIIRNVLDSSSPEAIKYKHERGSEKSNGAKPEKSTDGNNQLMDHDKGEGEDNQELKQSTSDKGSPLDSNNNEALASGSPSEVKSEKANSSGEHYRVRAIVGEPSSGDADDKDETLYEVEIIDENWPVEGEVHIVPFKALKRKEMPVTKIGMYRWLRKNTTRDTFSLAPLVLDDEWVAKFNLSTTFSEDVLERKYKHRKRKGLLDENGNVREDDTPKKKPPPVEEPEEEVASPPKVVPEPSKTLQKRIAIPVVKKMPIKYPIEDTLVDHNAFYKKDGEDLDESMPSVEQGESVKEAPHADSKYPVPKTQFRIPQNCVGDCLMIHDFLFTFSKTLKLTPFSLEDFMDALNYKVDDKAVAASRCELLFQIHKRLIYALLCLNHDSLKRRNDSSVSIAYAKEEARVVEEIIEFIRGSLPEDLETLGKVTEEDTEKKANPEGGEEEDSAERKNRILSFASPRRRRKRVATPTKCKPETKPLDRRTSPIKDIIEQQCFAVVQQYLKCNYFFGGPTDDIGTESDADVEDTDADEGEMKDVEEGSEKTTKAKRKSSDPRRDEPWDEKMYYNFDVPYKIQILRFLCDRAVNLHAIRETIEENLDRIDELRKKKYNEHMEQLKQQKESLETIKKEKKELMERLNQRKKDEKQKQTSDEAETEPMEEDDDEERDEDEFSVSSADSVAAARASRRLKVLQNQRDRAKEQAEAELAKKQKKDQDKDESKVKKLDSMEKKTLEEAKRQKEQRESYFHKEASKYSVRTVPLGSDRYRNRYWLFNSCPSKLFIESIAPYTPSPNQLKFTPLLKQQHEQLQRQHTGVLDFEWGYYNTMEQVNALLSFLDERGIREKALKKSLLKNLPKLQKHMKAVSKSKSRAAAEAKAEAVTPAEEAEPDIVIPQEMRRSSRIKTKVSQQQQQQQQQQQTQTPTTTTSTSDAWSSGSTTENIPSFMRYTNKYT